jgi:hypothetical protein
MWMKQGPIPYKFGFKNNSIYGVRFVIRFKDGTSRLIYIKNINEQFQPICDIFQTVNEVEAYVTLRKTNYSEFDFHSVGKDIAPLQILPTCYEVVGYSTIDRKLNITYGCDVCKE